MQVIIKKNNKLVKLGEGRIYSKSQLKLNEFTNGKVALTLNPNGQDVEASSVQNLSQKLMHQIPQATAVTVNPEDIKGATAPTFSSNDPRNDMVQNIPASKANGSVVSDAAKNGSPISITRDDSQQNGLGESKIVEMRRNSIPFSKKELSSFLNSL